MPKYECDCGARYTSLAGLTQCAANQHGQNLARAGDDEFNRLKAINAELLEALEALLILAEAFDEGDWQIAQARAAIASAKGES